MNAIHATLTVIVLASSLVAPAHAQTAAKPRAKPVAAAEKTEAAARTDAARTDAAPAEADRADIDRTSIVGNRELPKVLHIVPWKKPVPGELAGRPVSSVLDEALAPIDRDVFRRQVDYDAQARAQASRRNEPAPTR
jgi:hypothetical protein